MNKRQRKKLLCKAIRELNDEVSNDLGGPKITDREVLDVYNRIKNDKQAVNITLNDYKKHILYKERFEGKAVQLYA